MTELNRYYRVSIKVSAASVCARCNGARQAWCMSMRPLMRLSNFTCRTHGDSDNDGVCDSEACVWAEGSCEATGCSCRYWDVFWLH